MPNQPEETDELAAAYDLYGPRLYGYLMSVVQRPEASEDILQEVFCKLAACGALFGVRNAERYLFRAAHNEARRWLRRSRRARIAQTDETPRATPNIKQKEKPDAGAIRRALEALPAEQAEVVHLKVYEGMTFAEIARVVGRSANTVASRYRYACEKLRRMLGGLSDE